jgi:hypothetical protein
MLILAGAIYVGGALGMEMAAGVYDERHGYNTATTAVLSTIEETMEMVGLVVFIHALMQYLAAAHGSLCIRFTSRGRAGRASS